MKGKPGKKNSICLPDFYSKQIPCGANNLGRVFYVTTVFSTLKAFLLPFAQDFSSSGWEIHAIASGVPDIDLFKKNGLTAIYTVSWSRNPWNVFDFLSATRKIRRLVETIRPNIVHVHTPVAAFITRFAVRKLRKREGIRLVYTAHGFHFHPKGKPLANLIYTTLERVAGRWTDRLIVINEEDALASKRLKIVSETRLVIMPGIGIDPAYYDRQSVSTEKISRTKEEMGILPDDATILIVAELIRRKRHDIALKALAVTKTRGLKLLLAGPGPEFRNISRLARRLGILDRIVFLGYRNDIRDLISACDIFLLPSSQEGLPRSLMEAMAMETPAIASDIRGSRELLADSCGYLFPEGDFRALASLIDYVVEHPIEAAERAKQARKRIEGKYSLGIVLDMHRRLYNDLMKETSS